MRANAVRGDGFDHWRWLNNIHKWDKQRVQLEISRGIEVFSNTIGAYPSGFGSPGWLTTPEALSAVDDEPSFIYSSDCRGESPFMPEGVDTPQLPTTLPTLEETIRSRIGDEESMLAVIRQALLSGRQYHSYCLHTEVEGLKCPDFLHRLLEVCAETETSVGTLGEALDGLGTLPTCPIVRKTISGRFDPVSWQGRPLERDENTSG